MNIAAEILLCSNRGPGHTKDDEEAGSSKALQGKKYILCIYKDICLLFDFFIFIFYFYKG